MPYALLNTGESLLAGLADGQIYASNDKGESWSLLDVSGAPLSGLRRLTGPMP
jgi:hypothetical protein